jgi:hypothetical protein
VQLIVVFPEPARANELVNIEQVAVEFAAKPLTNKCLRVSAQYFALHRFTPLESAALEVVTKVGRNRAVGFCRVEVAHDGEAIHVPGILEELNLDQLFPLKNSVFVMGKLIHRLVGDVAEGPLLKVVTAPVREVVGLGLRVVGRDVRGGGIVGCLSGSGSSLWMSTVVRL